MVMEVEVVAQATVPILDAEIPTVQDVMGRTIVQCTIEAGITLQPILHIVMVVTVVGIPCTAEGEEATVTILLRIAMQVCGESYECDGPMVSDLSLGLAVF